MPLDLESLEQVTMMEWAAIDIEGDGNNPQCPVEIAVVQGGRTGVGDVRSWLVNPGRPIGPYVGSLHGLTDETLAGATLFGEIADDVAAAISGRVLVAHAAKEDVAMLSRVMPDAVALPAAILDTQRIARNLVPGLPRYSLGALVSHLGIQVAPQGRGGFHTAGFDALATAWLFTVLARVSPKNGRQARHFARCGICDFRSPEPEPIMVPRT